LAEAEQAAERFERERPPAEAFGTIESCFAGLLPELARYARQDPHDNGPERIPERRDSRRASGQLAERIRVL
jgi:hypothetical protein